MATVVFVCAHGALKSRLAAAMFNAAAPSGWNATSAGVQPQEAVSVYAAPLVQGTAAAARLELGPPQPLAARCPAELIIAIDCQVGASRSWRLRDGEPGVGMRDEIGSMVAGLVEELSR